MSEAQLIEIRQRFESFEELIEDAQFVLTERIEHTRAMWKVKALTKTRAGIERGLEGLREDLDRMQDELRKVDA